MPASNEFLPFAIDPGANVATQAAYVADGTYVDGFLAGLAKSPLMNKALRQASFVSSTLAQYVANFLGAAVVDNGSVSAFLTQLGSVFGNLPGAAHTIPFQSATGTTAYAGPPTAVGQTIVWNGTTFVMGAGSGDVVHWDTPAAGSGYILGGNGINRQWVTVFCPGAGGGPEVTVTYPSNTAFATEAIIESIVVLDPSRAGSASPSDSMLFGTSRVGLVDCDVYLGQNGGGVRDVTIVVTLKGK